MKQTIPNSKSKAWIWNKFVLGWFSCIACRLHRKYRKNGDRNGRTSNTELEHVSYKSRDYTSSYSNTVVRCMPRNPQLLLWTSGAQITGALPSAIHSSFLRPTLSTASTSTPLHGRPLSKLSYSRSSVSYRPFREFQSFAILCDLTLVTTSSLTLTKENKSFCSSREFIHNKYNIMCVCVCVRVRARVCVRVIKHISTDTWATRSLNAPFLSYSHLFKRKNNEY